MLTYHRLLLALCSAVRIEMHDMFDVYGCQLVSNATFCAICHYNTAQLDVTFTYFYTAKHFCIPIVGISSGCFIAAF